MNGVLKIHIKCSRTKRIIKTLIKRNTITYDAGDTIRALLAQRATDDAAAELQLGSMRFGTDTTTPTRYDTDLIAEVPAVRKQLQDANKVDGITGEISLQATMLSTEGNGNTFAEAGLFTFGPGAWNDGVGGSLTMFSRQVHAGIPKTSAFTLEYNWTIQFTT